MVSSMTHMYLCSDSRSGDMTVFLKCARHVDAWYSLGANEQSARVSSSPHRYGPLPFFKKAGRRYGWDGRGTGAGCTKWWVLLGICVSRGRAVRAFVTV